MRALPRISSCSFQYLGSRGAQLSTVRAFALGIVSILGLARSPTRTGGADFSTQRVSILGLSRSPTRYTLELRNHQKFQYLGSRGAQPGGELWGDSGPQFQYLGSRGAQRQGIWLSGEMGRFNTWAREEPNKLID